MREHTKVIRIGDRVIGGGNPVLIQSMTNTKTEDVQATVAHWIERYGLEEVQQWRFTILSFNYSQLSTIPMDYADYLEWLEEHIDEL